MSFVPFIDKVPPPFDELLMFGLPVVVLAIAMLCSLAYIRRSEGKTLFVAFTILALVDGALSLLIYVPAYLGA